jgi:hypothetical protein
MSEREAAGILGDPIERVEAWAAGAGAACEPVRLAVVRGLARRAAAERGLVRERLLTRLSAMLDEPMRGEAVSAAENDKTAASPPEPALASLSSLVDRLGRMPRVQRFSVVHELAPAGPPRALRDAAPQPLKSIAAFEGTWARLRVEQRLRQASAQVPTAAGPLNSAQLVSRTLHAMRALSPEYLDAFMSHVDTLLWLEHVSGSGPLAPRASATRTEAKRRPAAKAGRKA